MTSFVVHLALLLILAIWSIVSIGKQNGLVIESSSTDGEAALETFRVESLSEADDGAAGLGPNDVTTTVLVSPSNVELLETDAPGDIGVQGTLADALQTSGNADKTGASGFLDNSLESRSPKNRLAAAANRGATPASEAAVEAALAYLARHQRNDGSWNMAMDVCGEQCTDGCDALDNHEIAATGLALLCFLGAGHSTQNGEYSETVSKGVYFLVQALKYRERSEATQGYWLTEVAHAQMYEHGIATLALCEALQMGGDTALKEPCQAAVQFICDAQYRGGWNYHPGQPGDLSIVGWQMMALKSASAAKLRVPIEVVRASDDFLRQNSNGEYLFSYRKGRPTPSMTAIGNLIRLYRGWSVTDPAILRANDYLAGKAPSGDDVYYNFYATQFMFHLGGRNWKNWNGIMREMLIHSQVREGHMAGSWYFPNNQFNKDAGRIYVTAMCCLTLEVYYRYLPVYEASGNEFRL